MPQQDVALIVNPGCDLETSKTAVELADRFPFVYAAVGVHPSDCGPWQESWVDELKKLAAHPKVKACLLYTSMGTTPPLFATTPGKTTRQATLSIPRATSWADTRVSFTTPWASGGGWGFPPTRDGCM